MQIPFVDRLEKSRNVLVAGCGGGFDFVSGIPLATWLQSQGKTVTYANLSFSDLGMASYKRIGPAGYVVDEDSAMMDYFPERHFVDWLAARGENPSMVGFSLTGAVQLAETYREVVERYGIDTICLVDGGVDSIAKGDEADLASIEEDALSVVAVDMVEGVDKYLSCIGFGIDLYHGLCHYTTLENMAGLAARGAFLGTVSVQPGTPGGDAYLDCVDFLNARQKGHRSIVANSVADAIRGKFGDVHATDRTAGSEMFINPLLAQQWNYELGPVAALMGFRDDVRETTDFHQVANVIRLHHHRSVKRDWVAIPL